MKKQWVYKLVILFFSLWITKENVQAQKWCEPGAEWVFIEYYMSLDPPSKVRFFYQKDTLIKNQLCQKILCQGVGGVYCTDTFNYERNSYFSYYNNDTVWFYYDNAFRPVYMFNAQVGDTHVLRDLKAPWLDSITTYVVQSVGFEVVDGDTLRSYTIKMLQDTTLVSPLIRISERIGVHGIIFIPKDRSWYLDGESWGFVCYNDEKINFEGLVSHLTCDPCNRAVGVVEHILQNELLVYPNPVYDFLTLKVKGFSINEIEIKDITGKLLMSKRVAHFSDDNKIDVQGLNKGVYLITVHLANNETITQKFVKN